MKSARLLVLLLVACRPGRSDMERKGDDAWHAGRWQEAMTDYRAAGNSAQLDAKLADAALQAGMLAESAQAWTKLGTDDPSRTGEAAAGLARVAAAADRGDKQNAMALAIVGLRRMVASWPVGRLAATLSGPGNLGPEDVAVLIPAWLAGSPDRGSSEPLLVTLAQADRARGQCELAVPILEGVLRTTTNAGTRDTASTTMAWCALGLGEQALTASHPGEAEYWLVRAAHADSTGSVGRRAAVGIGDALVMQGDSLGALVVWQGVVGRAVPADSITQQALTRLQPLLHTPADSSAVPPVVRP